MALSVLVVDDEEAVVSLFRQRFRRELKAGTITLEFANSGEAAYDRLSGVDGARSVVLSDINMPGMSGLELLDKLRAEWPALPVIMVTAYGDPATRQHAHSLGAVDLIEKPIDFELLKARLAEFAAH